MQHTIKTLIAATVALAALSTMPATSAMAQTTGPGDHVLVNMAMDRNYNCVRSDAGTCLADTAPQMPNIPLMPSAGGGGASGSDHQIDRPTILGASPAHDVSAGYIDPGDNRMFIAISVVCVIGILILVHQFIRQIIRQKHSP